MSCGISIVILSVQINGNLSENAFKFDENRQSRIMNESFKPISLKCIQMCRQYTNFPPQFNRNSELSVQNTINTHSK